MTQLEATDFVDREQRIQTICLLVLSTIATGATLFWLRGIMVPFVLAVFFSIGLSPVINAQMQHLRFPSGLAIISTSLVFFALLAGIGTVVSNSVTQLAANAGAYQAQIAGLMNLIQTELPWQSIGLDPHSRGFEDLANIPAKSVGTFIVGTTNAILDLLSKGLIVMIFTAFLLAGTKSTPGVDQGVQAVVTSRIKRYLVSQTAISAATGSLVWLILTILGVDLAAVFGLFAFMLNFIPSLGSIIATLLPLPVVMLSPEISTTGAVLAIALPGIIQFIIGNVIAPKVLGDALNLHPVTVLLALMFWGALWGIVGMLLAVPITATLRIFLERFDITAPMARILSGQLSGAAPQT
jgi:AI-2 transport protein TqsA